MIMAVVVGDLPKAHVSYSVEAMLGYRSDFWMVAIAGKRHHGRAVNEGR